VEGTDLGHFVQMECMGGATRVLRIESDGEVGYLYLREGHVLHAITGRRVGEQAVFEMLGWTVGTIGSCERPWPTRPLITTSWQGLMLRAAQALDEAQRDASKVVPFPDVSSAAPPPSAIPTQSTSRGDRDMHAADEDGGSLPVGVRLDTRGHVVTSRGDVEELAPIAAYAKRVASLIGGDLGLDGFRALLAQTGGQRRVVFMDEGDLVATEPREGAPIESLLARLGLD